MLSAAYASSKLVELGKAEAFGAFDHHDGCVWDIYPYLNDGCGDQDVCFVFLETCHDFFLFFCFQLAVEHFYL